jgi:hypothetical protein
MSATAAARHRHVYRKDLQQLARSIHHSQGEAMVDKTADSVPMLAKTLMRTQVLLAPVAAMLVTLFMIWVFAHEKVEFRTVLDKPQSYSEEEVFRQHQNGRQVDRGDLAYAPGAANEWYVHSYDYGVANNYNSNALRTPLYPAGPLLIGALPICIADGRFTEAGAPARNYYSSTTETFDTRPVSFDGSNYLPKARLEVFIADATGSYAKPFDENPQWQAAAPFTVTCNNAKSNASDIAVTNGESPNAVGGDPPTRFGTITRRGINKDWWGPFNALIPTQWASYPPAELTFGAGARVGRFHQNVTTYSGTANPTIPHYLAAYGSDAANVRGHGDIER